MPDAAVPYIARDPSLTINLKEIICHMRSISLTPEDAEVDIATFCRPGDAAPGTTVWTMEISVLQSFGSAAVAGPPAVPATEGLFDLLSPLAKTRQPFVVKPNKGAAASLSNPNATGFLWVPSIPFLTAEIAEKSEFTLTMRVSGQPLFPTA